MSDSDYVVCLPVTQMPLPRVLSRKRDCCECGVVVWVAMSSPANASPVCTGCARGVDVGEATKVTPAQRAEMHTQGFDDDEIDRAGRALDAWLRS